MPNTGTITGLSPATSYALDAMHVDDWGNVSAVVSSDPFTTAAAASTTMPPYATKQVFAGSAGSAGAYTWENAPLGNGENYIGIGYLSGGNARSVEGFAVGTQTGLTPLVSASSANVSATRFYKVTSDGTPADIVLTLSANAANGVAMFLWTPGQSTVVVDSASSGGVAGLDPAIAADVNTEGGGKVIALCSVFATGATFDDLAGVALVTDGRVDVDTNDWVAAFEADVVSGQTPRAVDIGESAGGVHHAIAVLSIGAGA